MVSCFICIIQSYLRPGKISREKKDFYSSIFKTFSLSIWLAFVMSKVIFCQNSWKLKRNNERNKTKTMLIFFPHSWVFSMKGPLKFKHFRGNYLQWKVKYRYQPIMRNSTQRHPSRLKRRRSSSILNLKTSILCYFIAMLRWPTEKDLTSLKEKVEH